MKITLSKRIGLLAILLPCALALSTTVHAETNKLVIESATVHKAASTPLWEKEQWNDTRNLRQKVNKRTEKEWDKADAAFDNRDKCEQSANINAYWEPNTLRCLDRRTGRVITP
ncbi:protein [Escherichia coli]|nr:protein [Escherichia coli]